MSDVRGGEGSANTTHKDPNQNKKQKQPDTCSGSLVVSMSNAQMTGSARASRSARRARLVAPPPALTLYQCPARTSVSIA